MTLVKILMMFCLRNVIKTVNRIDEQETKTTTEDYGKYSFGGAFDNNYITPDTNSSEYQNTLKKMKADLQKAFSEGKKSSDLKIIIRSSASSNPATNGYTLSQPPNHNFVNVGKTDGGLLSGGKWVVRGESGWKNVAPNDQLNANTFLAKNRGIGMRDSLVKDLNSMGLKISTNNIQLLGREDGKWVADSKEPSEQYVNVIIDGLLETTTTIPKNYQIIYDWYQIGGKDTPYVLIDKTPSYSKKIQHSEWGRGVKELRKSFVDAVNSSKGVSVAGYSKSDEVEFYAFGTFNGYTSKKGNTFFYDNEKSWLNDLKKINSMNPANEFQMRKGDDNSKEKVEGVQAKGFWQPGKSGSADFHHGHGTDVRNNKMFIVKPTGVKKPVEVIQTKRVSGGKTPQPTAKPSL